MCLYPRVIENRKYKKTKKNGGNIPPIKDLRVKYVPIGCEHCIECRKQKSRGWQVRLLEDIKKNKNGKFVTFTFSNKSIAELDSLIDSKLEGTERDNEIAKIAIRRFLERWRKEYGKSLRHWLVTELGHKGTENIHIHGIIWTNESLDKVEQHWKYGFMWKGKKIAGYNRLINYVNGRTVSYIVKYIYKIDNKYISFKSKVFTSPGIGRDYMKNWNVRLNKFKGKETDECYQTDTGHKISMPVYWRNKIYTEEEREQLWLQRLDREERWVCGERVSIKNGEEDYYNLLKFHRARNKQLGYGDGKISWSRENYERERRELMRRRRIIESHVKAYIDQYMQAA